MCAPRTDTVSVTELGRTHAHTARMTRDGAASQQPGHALPHTLLPLSIVTVVAGRAVTHIWLPEHWAVYTHQSPGYRLPLQDNISN